MSDVKIRVKRSNQPGVLPGPLALGELAVNIPDKKIFIGNGISNTVLYDGTISILEELEEEIRDLVAATLVAGDNVNIDYDDTNDTITISLSPDIFQRLLGDVLIAGTGITLDYNDTNDTVTINTEVWERSDATLATDVFGIPKDTIIPPGSSAIEILEQILYPFQTGAITSFTINSSTPLEIGQTLNNPLFSWSLSNVSSLQTLTFSWLSNSFSISPIGNRTNYNPGAGTIQGTAPGYSITFTLNGTQTATGYNPTQSTRTITWLSKVYVGRRVGEDSNITNVNQLSSGTSYFVNNTASSTQASGGYVTVPAGSGYVYILVHKDLPDLSAISIEQTAGQLTAFAKVASAQNIANSFDTHQYKVYKSFNELSGQIRLDFT